MIARRERNVVVFVGLYLLVSMGPYAVLNPELVATVLESYYPPDLLGVVVFGLAVVGLLASVVLTERGIERYVQFLFWPSDALSVLLNLAYTWAAVSWWVLPELIAYVGLDVGFGTLLGLSVASQLPAVLFLALLTILGEAKAVEDQW